MSKLSELTAVFLGERIRWPGDVAIITCDEVTSGQPVLDQFGCCDLREPITIKIACAPDDLVPNLTYRFYGHWTTHPKHGRQFLAKTFVRSQPHGQAGVIRYLMQCPHVGQATASKLWEKFAGDAVRILREQPDVAAAAIGGQFSEEKAVEAAAFLEREKGLEAATIDLINLLGGRGFPRDTARKAIAEFGNVAAELVKRNPYLLQRFRGCGFLRCDQMFLDLGGHPARLKRQAYCCWHTLASNTDGHTWFPKGEMVAGLATKIGGAEIRPLEAAKLAKRGRLIAVHRDNLQGLWFAEARKARNESTVARRVCEMLADPCRWPAVDGLDVSEHQAEQLGQALAGQVAVFGGSPGTGKTYTAARLIDAITATTGAGSVAVAAPTGKAAVRISELMEGYGLKIRARTIHSLLGVAQRTEGDGWGFNHGPDNPLPFQWIVVDESSMIDTDLMAAFLSACGRGTHVLFVGDTNQLPPVGHGAPLRDMIAAGVPYGELREIRRNSGSIVRACAAIRDGQRFEVDDRLNPDDGHNLTLVPAGSGAAAVEAIVDLLQKIRERGLADAVWDCQVVVAVNAKSELSRKALNKRLQLELNPGGRQARGNPFRVGDKVVNTKNGFLPVVDDAPPDVNAEAMDGKVFVANGELGKVVDVQEKLTTVSLEGPKRLIKIPRGGREGEEEAEEATGTGCNWDLGYALSVHKSQGSEWPIVIVALDEYPGARLVCDRSWCYTAISRAKKVCFLVGRLGTAHSMCRRNSIQKRKTFLKELLEDGVRRSVHSSLECVGNTD